jgi:hypothetical protein
MRSGRLRRIESWPMEFILDWMRWFLTNMVRIGSNPPEITLRTIGVRRAVARPLTRPGRTPKGKRGREQGKLS